MAENLDININGKDNLSGPAGKAGKSLDNLTSKTVNSGKATSNANLAFIELGRGVSDAKFGFAGLGNNLQRMVEIFGNLRNNTGSTSGALKALAGSILGPGAIVAGVSILIGYLPEIISFFRGIVGGANAAEAANESLQKTLANYDKIIGNELKGSLKILKFELNQATKLLYSSEEGTRNYQKALAFLKKHGIDPIALGFNETEIAIDSYLRSIRNATKADAGREKAIKDLITLGTQRAKGLKEIENRERILANLQAKDPIGSSREIARQRAAIERLKEDVISLNPLFFKIFEDYGDLFLDGLVPDPEKVKAKGKQVGVAYSHGFLSGVGAIDSEIGNLLAGIDKAFLESGITQLGTSIGSALANGTNVAENAGKALLGVLGDLAIKIGKIVLTTGLGLEGLKLGLSNPFTAGPAAIAAGIGLIAAGAALKGLAGGSGARGSSGGSPVAGSRATTRVADTTSSNVTFTIGNNELIGSLQQGLNKRGTTHGSATLFPG